MFTTCPKCTLTLLVTAPDLRAGQGYVRCGRCANVFNALINLTDGGAKGAEAGTPEDPELLDSTSPGIDRAAEQFPSEAALDEASAGLEAVEATDFEAPEIDEPQIADPEVTDPEIDAPLMTLRDLIEAGNAKPEEAPAEIEIVEPEIVEPIIPDQALEFHPETTSVNEIFVDVPREERDITTGAFESIVLEGDPSGELSDKLFEDNSPSSVDLAALRVPTEPDFELPAPSEPVLDLNFEADDAAKRKAKPVQLEPDEVAILELLEREQLEEAVAAATQHDLAPAEPPPPEPLAIPPVPPRRVVNIEAPEPVFPDAEAVAERFIERRQNERLHKLLLGGSIALGVLLVAQFIHQGRHSLAASDVWGAPVRKLYAALGAPITPKWDVAAYEVRQLGAEAESGDATRLLVRASVRNTATRAQPLPLLRLTLQDRYGNAVATRDLLPREYLPAASAEMTELAADQRLDTEIRVVDPGRSAIGFEIDACLATASSTLTCSNDARRRLQSAAR